MSFSTRLLLALPLLAACGAAPAEDSGTSADDLSSKTLDAYFELAGDSNNDQWIEAIALHADGSFEANMGNDVSNLSGHHFAETGTYTLDASALVLNGERWDVTRSGDTLRVKGNVTWFTMKKTPLVTLTFAADWTVSQSAPLVANEALLVRYAASRDACKAPAKGGLFVSALAQVDDGLVTGLTDEFGSQPVHGFLGALGFVPQGKDLALWFESGATDSQGGSTCSHWDSRFGQNYHFAIATK
ncbi:MAG TPA: DUF6209 family protein [Labilithrix sp.]